MGSIVAIANQKGGVGKTTLTVHLGAYLSQHGYRICIVDADPQGNSTQYLMPEGISYNGLCQALLPPYPSIPEALIAVGGEWQLHLCPGSQDTAHAMTWLSSSRRPFETITQTLDPLRNLADVTLIDMPPSQAAGFQELLYAADLLLVPTQLERASLTGVSLMHRTIQEIQKQHGHAPTLLGIVPNMARHTIEHSRRLDELTHAFGPIVWPPIRHAIAVASASGYCESLFTYAPRAKVSHDMITICQRFVQNAKLLDQ